MKRRIVFLVHTEYHLMVALSLYADVYAIDEETEVVIYQTDTGEKKRFQFDFDFSVIPDVAYYRFYYNERQSTTEGFEAQVQNILANDVHTFVCFNQHSLIDVYLIKSFSKKGTRIALAPDGTKPYGSFSNHAWKWRFKTLWRYVNFIHQNKLPWTSLSSFSLRYGDMKEINELWLAHVKEFRNDTGKVIRNIEVLQTAVSRELINSFFNSDFKTTLPLRKVLLYLNQPFRDAKVFHLEQDVLNTLIKKFTDYKLVVKLHPQSPPQVWKVFEQMGATIITTTFPAELYIVLLKDSLIVNFWSAASLVNNDQCRFYWLKPMLVEKRLMLNNVSVANPTLHIKEVHQIDQIV